MTRYYPDGVRRYVHRDRPRTPAGTPFEVAQRRAVKLGMRGRDYAHFLRVFRAIRAAEVAGIDTEPMWREYNADPDGHVAVAAYVQAVASTRKPGYAE